MAQMSTAEINNLPDSDFAYIEPGGTKDASGRTEPRSLRHFPIHDAAHVRNALARIAQGAQFGKQALPKVEAAAKKFGIDTAQRADDMDSAPLWLPTITRSFPLEDIDVHEGEITCERCHRKATGRMVDALAAVFDIDQEVYDAQGHYVESIDRSAFNKAISDWSRSRGIGNVAVFYNHGKTLYDTPSERGSVPLGHPAAIRADARGLVTTTHYGTDPFSDQILQKIKNGDISGHSFTGRTFRSDPERVPFVKRGGSLPRVRRLELGLKEYGPTPIPYYEAAEVLAVRSGQATDQHSYNGAAGTAPPLPTGAGTEEPPQALRSADEYRQRIVSNVDSILRAHAVRSVADGSAAGNPGPSGEDQE